MPRMLLTTRATDGTVVDVPVRLLVASPERAYLTLAADSAAAQALGDERDVRLARCNPRSRPVSSDVPAHALATTPDDVLASLSLASGTARVRAWLHPARRPARHDLKHYVITSAPEPTSWALDLAEGE